MGSVHCFFCGGHKCKYENYSNWLEYTNTHNAIEGLFSNWITDSILATARPSDRLIQQYDIIQQFHQHEIGAIINLQQAGEHRDCGDGLINNQFSYSPDDFMRANIFYYNFGWKDMTVPPLDLVLNVVQVICFTMSQNKKVAIHCHAGLGRTGLVIACYLVYTNQLSAQEAIMQVRTHRPLSIQTAKQANFIHAFEEFTRGIRMVWDETMPSLQQVLTRQRKYLHGPELLALRHVPKIIHVTCERLSEWCETPQHGDAMSRNLTEEEKALLVRYKGEADEGKWENVRKAEGVVAVRMLLEWLNQLSPRLLHEASEDILGGKPPQAILPSLSESARRSLLRITPTLHKMIAATPQPPEQHTLYSMFAKALVPFSKSNNKTTAVGGGGGAGGGGGGGDGGDGGAADPQLLNAIAFLRDVKL